MEVWLWYFWIYRFLGYLLEKAFAVATKAERRERKCFLLLPMCPVYGLGMAAVLALPASWRQGAWMILAGGVVTTLVEYAVHWGYEALLGVRFWDYSRVPGNLQGRVCLPFSVAWGLLAALAIRFLQPAVHFLAAWFPAPVTYGFLLLFITDAICSARFLWITHDVEELRVTGWSI